MEAIHELDSKNGKYEDFQILEGPGNKPIVSEEEYWEYYLISPYGRYEWNNGRLEERPMTDGDSYLMFDWFNELLRQFLKVNPIGMTMGLDFAFRLALHGKTTIRKPDLTLILGSNPVQPGRSETSYKGIFDLCVESLSHSGTGVIRRDTVVKKKEYEAIGVQEYYILDFKGKHTAFYHLGKQGKYEHIKPVNDVIHSNILPGFRFRVADLYARPSLEEMAEDDVYASFALPSYTMEKRRAEQEKMKVEQEKQKVERMTEKLRALGVSEEEIKSLTES